MAECPGIGISDGGALVPGVSGGGVKGDLTSDNNTSNGSQRV